MSTTASTLEVLITARNDATAGLNQLETQLKRASQSADATAAAVGGTLARAERAAAADALRLAQAEARGLSIKGDLTGASTRLGGAITAYRAQMDGSTASALKLVSAENQLASVQARVASGSAGLGGALGGLRQGMSALTTTAGALGIALGAQQLVAFGVGAARASMELGAAQNALKQIAGDTQTYTTILAAAKQQQILFGGSLASNLNDMSSFAVSSRVAGADLNELIRTAQRLATLDPAQGIQGAKLALNEALSGNAVSLNRRFEIPKAMLDGLSSSATSAADKLAIVNRVLDKAGISANGAADTITKEAQAYNKLGAALDAIKTKAGGTLARGFAPAAEQLATSLGTGDQATQAAQSAKTFANYKQQLAEIDAAQQKVWGNDIVGRALGSALAAYQPLTQAQFAYVQALQAQGVATDAAIQKAQQQTSAASLLDQAINANVASNSGLADSLTSLIPAYAAAAAGSDQNAQAAANLLQSYLAGTVGIEATRQGLAQLAAQNTLTANTTQQNQAVTDPYVQSLTQQRDVTTQVTAAMLGTDQALLKDVTDKQAATQQTATLGAVQEALASLGPAVASGLIASGQGARILASGYGIAIEQGTQLLNIQAQLANKQFQLKSAQIRVDAAIARTGVGLGDEVQRDRQAQRAANVASVNQKAAQAAKAQRAYDLALGSTDKKLSIFNADLATATQRYGANSAEAITAKLALDQFTAAQTRATAAQGKATGRATGGGGGGAGSGGVKLSDQQQLDNRLAAQQDTFQNQSTQKTIDYQRKLESLAQDHQDRILKIQADALAKQQAQAAKNEVDKRESEVGFLERLTGSDLNKSKTGQGDLQRINAAYYQQFARAQQAAQSGDVARSQQLLDLAEKRSSLELDYAEKIDAARQKKDQNEAGRLQTLLGMRRQILDVEDQQAAQAGDSIKAEAAQQLADENSRYAAQVQAENANFAQSLGDIALKADQSANRQVAAAARAGKAIDTQKLSVDALNLSYQNLGATLATTPGTTPTGVPASTPVLPVAPVAPAAGTDLASVLGGLGAKLDAISAKLDTLPNIANHADISGVVSTLGSVGRDIKGAVASMPRAFG